MSKLGHYGFMVGRHTVKGETFFAEVVPSGEIHWYRRFLPWVGNWWFEVHSDKYSYAYEKGGSGGAYTLRACIRKADVAVEALSSKDGLEVQESKAPMSSKPSNNNQYEIYTSWDTCSECGGSGMVQQIYGVEDCPHCGCPGIERARIERARDEKGRYHH